MTLTTSLTDAFPSSAAFDIINSTLGADEAERKDVIKQANTVVGINLKNAQGQEESWYIDLKEKGVAGKGAGPPGKKAEGKLFSALSPSLPLSLPFFLSLRLFI